MQTPNSLEKSNLFTDGAQGLHSEEPAPWCLCLQLITRLPLSETINFKEGGLFLSHTFPGCCSQLVDPTALTWSWWEVRGGTKPYGNKQEQDCGPLLLEGMPPLTSRLPSGPGLLKVPSPPDKATHWGTNLPAQNCAELSPNMT